MDDCGQHTWGVDRAGLHGADAGGPQRVGGTGASPVRGVHSAGGIGGLLAGDVQSADPGASETGGFSYCYDADSDVGEVLGLPGTGAGGCA